MIRLFNYTIAALVHYNIVLILGDEELINILSILQGGRGSNNSTGNIVIGAQEVWLPCRLISTVQVLGLCLFLFSYKQICNWRIDELIHNLYSSGDQAVSTK